MKKLLFILASLAFIILSCQAQKSDIKKNSPDEKITVKREYDKDGNLIRFDSIRVYNWSTDSTLQFHMDGGWADFFGKEFFDQQFLKNFPGDSAFFHPFSQDILPFRFFDEDDFFKGFELDQDSTFLKNFMFRNDTSFFMGPHSSMMLPPGFFTPDLEGMQDLERFFDKHFKSFSPEGFFGFPGDSLPHKKFINPRQKEEWENMIRRQQKEQEEFMKRWKR